MTNHFEKRRLIETSLDRVQRWVEEQNYRGYEPFDGLSSWFRPLTFGTLLGDRLLLQLIRQCPINLRPIMGVPRKDSTKGRGYMASGYLARYRTTRDAIYLSKAEACLDWLDRHKAFVRCVVQVRHEVQLLRDISLGSGASDVSGDQVIEVRRMRHFDRHGRRGQLRLAAAAAD